LRAATPAYEIEIRNDNDAFQAVSSVNKSSDGGATWTQLTDAPWKPRIGFGPLLTNWKRKLWVVHGGTYEGRNSELFADVWTFDGVKWELILDSTPWLASMWSTTFVLNNELFVLAGRSPIDRRMLWRTKDGVHWRSSFPLPRGNAHACCATQTDRGVPLAPTDWNQTTRLLK
jgi:hypothetical protein